MGRQHPHTQKKLKWQLQECVNSPFPFYLSVNGCLITPAMLMLCPTPKKMPLGTRIFRQCKTDLDYMHNKRKGKKRKKKR